MNTPQPLPPGNRPRLDALSKDTIRVMCAEAVGLCKIEYGKCTEWDAIKNGWKCNKCGIVLEDHLPIPNYPEDANAALTLCDWMSERGWPMEFSTIPNIKEWTVTFGWDRSIKATADTLPLAICKTFLLANNLAQ